MREAILTQDYADGLNKLVQDLIDPRLCLICNYDPDIRYAISEDAIYITNVMDLYIFAIDCMPIKLVYRFLPSKRWPDSDAWNDLRQEISCLRTAWAHNSSEKDGEDSQIARENYKDWVSTVIGKVAPETLDDYKLLNDALKQMAKNVRRYLESFIRAAAADPNRDLLVKKWIDDTLKWYSSNTKTAIYRGWVKRVYIAQAKMMNINIDKDTCDWNVTRWIASVKRRQLKCDIDKLYQAIKEDERKLAGGYLSPEEKAEIQKRVQKQRSKIDTLKEKIDWKDKDLLPEFNKGLAAQLRATMDYLEKEEEGYTLLPQDLFATDIRQNFQNVQFPR